MAKAKTTPLMEQYFQIREQYPEAMLFFQVGDFYELFFDDAVKASSFLAIALTKRGKDNGKDIPLCGVPIHALNHYLVKLIKGGFTVAICDQLEKPQAGKVVKRGVTQVFTPGTLTDAQMLDDKSASYLLSFYPQKDAWGLIFTELLTAQLFATTIPAGAFRTIDSELIRFFPDEIIVPQAKSAQSFNTYFKQQGYTVSAAQDDDAAAAWIEKQFSDTIVQQINRLSAVQQSLQQLYWYLKRNQERALDQFKNIQFYEPDDYVILDAATQKNLEIIRNVQDGGRKNTLFSVLDKAVTPMGSRTIKKWLLRPLVQKKAIVQRQQVVHALKEKVSVLQQLEEVLSAISDIERIIGRVALSRAQVHDYLALKQSLVQVPALKSVLYELGDVSLIIVINEKLQDFSALVQLLDAALDGDSTHGHTIKTGFDHELDRLRSLVENSRQAILQLEQQEVTRTGIGSLKIRYNNVAGYYIEVTNPNLDKVPADYIQQNTLVNRKRFVTQELKDLERDIIRAQNEIETVERAVFDRVKKDVADQLPALRAASQALSYLDALFGFARVAYNYGYVVPTLTDRRDIIIEQGRHPVVEQKLQSSFVSNDTRLTDDESMWVLTGPNMGGKSTYLRQVALISIMAQCGSLIPAQAAQLPILDRIFTRIGAGDNVAEGKSTFLVEMEETAVICTQATRNSLVILDEVGRGTSTFDGMAIAQAIIEYLAQQVQARCLFATHYHELTHLKDHFANIANYHMVCKRTREGIAFVYKVEQGVSEGSFGIEVARLAQLPEPVVVRSEQILRDLDALERKKDAVMFTPFKPFDVAQGERGLKDAVMFTPFKPFDVAQGERGLKDAGVFLDASADVQGDASGVALAKMERELQKTVVRPECSEAQGAERNRMGLNGEVELCPAHVQEQAKTISSLKAELQKKDALLAELESVTLDDLSPRKAFELVWALKEKQKSL